MGKIMLWVDWLSLCSGLEKAGAVERFIRAGNVVLKDETWVEIPEANRRAVEAAVDGVGLSIEEVRRRIRMCAEEEPEEYCADTNKNAEEGGIRRIPDVEGTGLVYATCKYVTNVDNWLVHERKRRKEGASRLAPDKNAKGNISQLWKTVEMMDLRNNKQESKIEDMELKIEILEQQNKELKARMESLEGIIAGMRSIDEKY